jgi:hypothetical protein
MAESPESLFRRGMISEREHSRLKALAGTKVQNSRMAGFDEKDGRRDQGGRTDKGHRVGATAHIDNMRNPKGDSAVAKRPSKDGRAGAERNPARSAEIDDGISGGTQRPEFPRGAGPLSKRAQPGFVPTRSKGLAGATRGDHGANDRGPDNKTPRRARGQRDTLSSGGPYGGPSSRANG